MPFLGTIEVASSNFLVGGFRNSRAALYKCKENGIFLANGSISCGVYCVPSKVMGCYIKLIVHRLHFKFLRNDCKQKYPDFLNGLPLSLRELHD